VKKSNDIGTDSACTSEDSRLAAALESYLAVAEAGQPPDRDDFLARYPDVALELAGCLDELDRLSPAGWRSPGEAPPLARRAGAEPPESPRANLGDYRILGEIGRGGMGVVYEAEQLSLGRHVALKVLPLAATLDPRHLQRFRNEAQAAAHLHHPNIVPVHAVGCERGVHYYAMQLIRGRNLADIIREQSGGELDFSMGPPTRRARGPLLATIPYVPAPAPPTAQPTAPVASETVRASAPAGRDPGRHRAAARLAIQAATALDYAHQMGVVHRDIKPANLMLDERGNLWVTDFGLAQFQASPGLTQTGDLFGTLRYMSPEQALTRHGLVGHRTDIYSLGVTLYELLTLRPAVAGANQPELLQQIAFEDAVAPRRLDPTIPAELETIVLKAIAKHPEDRYATAQDFADDLQRFLDDRPILARPTSLTRRAAKWARRHRPVVVSVAVAATLLVVGALVGLAEFAIREKELGEQQARFAHDREVARQQAARALYRTKLDHATALTLARVPGYRDRVWRDLHAAAALDVPAQSGDEIGARVLACLGDPIGLPSPDPSTVSRPTAAALPEEFRELVRPAAGQPPPVWAFAPGGLLLARRTGAGVALVGKDGMTQAQTTSPLSAIYHLAFTPDGQTLLAGCEEGVVAWSVPALTVRSVVRSGNVTSVAAHPHGRLFALAGRRVELWSLITNRPVATFLTPEADAQVEFTADGRFLLAVRSGSPVAAWPVSDTPEKRSLAGHDGGVPGVAFSPDGTALASVAKDRVVKVWDAASGALRFAGTGHAAAIEAVAFSADGRLLASGDIGGEVRVWDWSAGCEVAHCAGPGRVWRLQFGPAGRFLAAGGDSGVMGWAIRRDGAAVALEPFLKLNAAGVIDLAVHPAGFELAFLDRAGRLWTYDLRQAAGRRALGPPARAEVRSLAFDASGGQFTFVSPAGTLGLLDWASGGTRLSGWRAFQVARGSRGWVATPTPAGAVALYDVTANREVFTLPAEEGDVWDLALSPDGQRLVVGRSDGSLAVWDLAQVRTRLAEFGVDVPAASPAAAPQPGPLPDEFERLVARNRDRVALDETEAKAGAAWAADDQSATRDHCLKALALRAKMGQAEPAGADDRFQLIGVHAMLGTAHLHFREFKAARLQLDRALALAARLAADYSVVPKYREAVGNAYYLRSVLLRQTGKDREAVAAFRPALPIREALAAESPGQARPAQRLAAAYRYLGVLLAKTGEDDEAEVLYRKALARCARLAADFPTTPEDAGCRSELMLCRHDLAALLARTGRAKEADALYHAAVALGEALVADCPAKAQYRYTFATVLGEYGVLCRNTGDVAEAARLFQRAMDQQREAVRLAPGNPTYRQWYLHRCFRLAETLRQLGHHADSVRAAGELAEAAGRDGGQLLRAARLVARCIPVAQADPALSETDRGAVVEGYEVEAIRLLTQAAAHKAKGIELLDTDPDFAPLRSRTDFQEVVAGTAG
jgi:serine/threonine protein kinase/WD40 repeat protein/tetratricopeptide (TPR) repeat protein